jgi:hypothetical protein
MLLQQRKLLDSKRGTIDDYQSLQHSCQQRAQISVGNFLDCPDQVRFDIH